MSSSELATSYASLILADEGIEISAEKIITLINAAKIESVEPVWATLLAKALEGKNVVDMLSNVGAGGAAPAAGAAPVAAAAGSAAVEKVEEKVEEKEESDDDMGFGLFDCESPSNLEERETRD